MKKPWCGHSHIYTIWLHLLTIQHSVWYKLISLVFYHTRNNLKIIHTDTKLVSLHHMTLWIITFAVVGPICISTEYLYVYITGSAMSFHMEIQSLLELNWAMALRFSTVGHSGDGMKVHWPGDRWELLSQTYTWERGFPCRIKPDGLFIKGIVLCELDKRISQVCKPLTKHLSLVFSAKI